MFTISSIVFFLWFIFPICQSHLGDGDVGGWSYRDSDPTCDGSPENLCSPLYWGNLYPQCNGKVQSPVNLAEAVRNDLIQPPQFKSISGGCKEWLMGASTSSFSAQFSASGCYNLTMTFQGIKYYLEQLHFHSPSEHTIGGGLYAAEAHLIHRSFDNYDVFLLVGVFLDITTTKHDGTNNTFLNTLWNIGGQTMDSIAKNQDVIVTQPLNPYATLFPGADGYFSYTGSLTTPPCNTNASWIVFSTPVPISSDDLDILRGVLLEVNGTVADFDGSTSRPVVPAAGREIFYTAALSVTDDISLDDDESDELARTVAYTALGISIFATVMGIVGFYALYQAQKRLIANKLSAPLLQIS